MTYIQYIKTPTITQWANGKRGEIKYFEQAIGKDLERKYRFVEIKQDKLEYVNDYQGQRKSPILAEGIVAYWLSEKNKSTKEIFDTYLRLCFEEYKRNKEKDIKYLNKDLLKKFLRKDHLLIEKVKMDNSKALFPFVGKKEEVELCNLIQVYKRYVHKQSRKVNLWEPLLKVWNIVHQVLPSVSIT